MNRILFLAALLAAGCASEDRPTDQSARASGDVVVLEGASLCPSCRIGLTEVALLGSSADPASVAPGAGGRDCSVARKSTGDWLVSSVMGAGEIQVYARNGRVKGTIGRRGGGPGELGEGLRLSVDPHDTLFVLDSEHARLSVFDESGTFVRSFSIPNQIRSFSRLDEGEMLFSRTPAEPNGFQFFLVDKAGVELGQFRKPGSETLEIDDWIVASASSGGFWMASIWEYRIHRRAAFGQIDLTLVREVSWFPPNGRYRPGMPNAIPTAPVLKNIWDDGKGHLWILSIVADPSWEPDLPTTPFYDWSRQVFDSVIEVIDIDEGQLLASLRHDQMLGKTCEGPFLYSAVEARDGDTRLQVFEPVLSDPGDY